MGKLLLLPSLEDASGAFLSAHETAAALVDLVDKTLGTKGAGRTTLGAAGSVWGEALTPFEANLLRLSLIHI